jgi:hypothetical protein
MSVPPIVLYVNFYTDKSSVRQQELVHCQCMNGQLNSIDQIYMIVDDVERYKHWKTDYPKIQLHFMSSRPTFTDFFKLSNQTQNHPQQINIVANTDIYFTSSLDKLKTFNWKNRALCLSRQDTIINYSQDVWAWQGPMKNISSQSSFFLGIPGCDNRIAYVLHSNGYELHNPAKEIIAIHVHTSMVRNYAESSRIQEDGVYVDPTYLGEHSTLHFTNARSSRSRSKSKSRSRSLVSNQMKRSPSTISVKNRASYSLSRNRVFIRNNNIRTKPVHTKRPIQTKLTRSFRPKPHSTFQRQNKIRRTNIGINITQRRILKTIRRRK